MMTSDEAKIQQRLLGRALLERGRGNTERCIALLDEPASRPNCSTITVLLMLAHVVIHFDGYQAGIDSIELIDANTGEHGNPDELFPDPHSKGAAIIWCARFVTALSNHDKDQVRALLGATPSDKAAAVRMGSMIDLACRAVMATLEASKGGE